MLELFQDGVNEEVARLRPVGDVEPGWFAGMSKLPSVVMEKAAKTARGLGVGISAIPILEDKYYGGTSATTKYMEGFFKPYLERAVDYWTPKPNEIGVATDIIGSLTWALPNILGTPLQLPFIAATQLDTAAELINKHGDVTPTQANLVGATQAVALGLGIKAPIYGTNWWQRMLVGGAGANVALGIGSRGISGAVLGDSKAAEEFKAFDEKGIFLDFFMGGMFGLAAELSPHQKAEGSAAWKHARAWFDFGRSLKPSEKDAALVAILGGHINSEISMPGRPATAADVSAHVDRMRQAIDQVVTDQPIDVQNIRVQENVPRETIVDVAGQEITGKDTSNVENVEQNQMPAPDVVLGRIEPTFRDPQFTPDTERLAAAERAVTELRAEAERVRLAEGLPKVVMDMALIDRAREADPDAFENIPTNFDDAQYMAAVREIVDANKPRTQETDQGRQADAGEAAQTGLASPRAQGGGDFPPPLTAAGKPEGAANNPLANEARRFAAENPDIKVNVGTDEQGQPVYKTLNEMLDDAAAETELAMQDVQLFAVAAECLLGVA
jgi:hypothetical protein